MPLTDTATRNAKSIDGKQIKKFDGGGLYLLVRPNGSKLWQMAYRFAGKGKTLSFGIYPDVTLVEARRQREAAKDMLRAGTDPGMQKKLDKLNAEVTQRNTFDAVADDFLAKMKKDGKAEITIWKTRWVLKDLAKPLKDRPMSEIKPIEILSILQSIENSGRFETAHRVRGTIGSLFRFAISTLRAESDPTYALRGALRKKQHVNRPAITDPKAFGKMLALIDEYQGWPTLTAALQIEALCFQRPFETRSMEWAELDLPKAKWTIPAGKMKMRVEHEVPLSKQAIGILKEIRKFSGEGRYVFPSLRTSKLCLSENAMNSALRRMGIGKDEHCSHGFRSSASSILNERGYDRDWIEAQLAHLDQNEVRRIYNRAKYWPQRVKMMQDWADLCDQLKAGKVPA